MTPRVCVLLAACNGGKWLPQQLATILGQVDVDVRVVCSVDTSTDGTEPLIDEWAARDPRVTVLPHGSRFGGAARNFYRLLRDTDLGDATHVAFADQDDVWLPDKLARAARDLDARGPRAAYSSNVWTWQGEEVRLLDKAQPQRSHDHLYSSAGPGCTYVLDRVAVDELRTWLSTRPRHDEVEFHDWLFYAWARTAGVDWRIDPSPTMLYRQHDANQFGANRGVGATVRRVRSLRSSWYLDEVALVAEVVGVEPPHLAEMSGGVRDRLRAARAVGDLRRSRRDRMALAASIAAGQLTRSERT